MSKYAYRSELMLSAAKYMTDKIMKKTVDIHLDMPEETKKFLKTNHNVLYVAPHKSLWETVGIPYIINKEGLQTPYIVAAHTLVRGAAAVYAFKKLGIVVANVGSKNKRQSAFGLADNMVDLMTNDISLLVFPEESRSAEGNIRRFKTTAAEAAIRAKSTVIPVNVDYSKINEEELLEYRNKVEHEKLAKEASEHGVHLERPKYTFKAHHQFRWFRPLGDIYLTFGAPITAMGDRKTLTEEVRTACMDLVKIQPINVVAYALMQDGIPKFNIIKTLHDLAPQKHKFVGMTLEDTADDLLRKSNLTGVDIEISRPYAGYIAHYLNPIQG